MTWCYTTQKPLIMKVRSLLLLSASLLIPFGAFAAEPDYVPMKINQTDPVIFPHAAKDVGITTGMVRVTIQVDVDGKLSDYLVTGYTYPAFATAAVTALKHWDFEPAYIRGRPHSATADLTFNFKSEGLVLVDLTMSTYIELRNFELHPSAFGYHACTLRQLDRIPTPTKVVKPTYVTAKAHPTTTITVDFYIDEKGRVRMPAVSREAGEENEQLAAAAIDAVSQWQFEPPMSKGVPVLVAARQDFNFTSKP